MNDIQGDLADTDTLAKSHSQDDSNGKRYLMPNLKEVSQTNVLLCNDLGLVKI